MSQAATYDAMFPTFTPITKTVRTNAKLEHTLKLIPQVVAETLGQTREVAKSLRGQNTLDTCRNTWEFCKRNFKYKQDEDGKEQVRSPRRSWQDRHLGIDCDCYSTLISSILTNLRIPHMLRVTKYPDPAGITRHHHVEVLGRPREQPRLSPPRSKRSDSSSRRPADSRA